MVKTKKLKKSTVKKMMKGSKSKNVTIIVKVGTLKENRQYATKYKKIFKKKNIGKQVKQIKIGKAIKK